MDFFWTLDCAVYAELGINLPFGDYLFKFHGSISDFINCYFSSSLACLISSNDWL